LGNTGGRRNAYPPAKRKKEEGKALTKGQDANAFVTLVIGGGENGRGKAKGKRVSKTGATNQRGRKREKINMSGPLSAGKKSKTGCLPNLN